MRLTTFLSILLIVCCLSELRAQDKIPKNLHGYWLLEGRIKGNWGEILVGSNYIEFLWDLYHVDQIIEDPDSYKVRLSNPLKGNLTVRIKIISDSVATFHYNVLNAPLKAKLSPKHPDIIYYNTAQVHKQLPGKWLLANNDSREFSFNNNKMNLDGKTWDVLWFGEYLKREHRALLRNGEQHRLVYFKPRESMINIGGDGQAADYRKKPAPPEILPFVGNWYHKGSNHRTIGFFEDFAIYNGLSWDYENLTRINNMVTVTIRNKNQRIVLQLSKSKYDNLSLKIGGKAAVVLYRPALKAPAPPLKNQLHFKKQMD